MSDSLLVLLEMIEEVLEEQKKANKGNVLEGIVASALGALFLNGASQIEKRIGAPISQQDLFSIIDSLQFQGDQKLFYEGNIPLPSTSDSSTLKVSIELKNIELQTLKNLTTNEELQKIYKNELGNTIKYVNNDRFRQYAHRITTQPVQEILVLTIGKAQAGTTADLKVVIDGEEKNELGGISLKGITTQLTQMVMSATGTGNEIPNFLNAIDDKLGLLFEKTPNQYQKFKQNITNLLTPLVGCNAILEPSREELYISADQELQKCKLQVQSMDELLNNLRQELQNLLIEVAGYFNSNPEEFADVASEFIKKNIGAEEYVQIGKELNVGRPASVDRAIKKMLKKQAENENSLEVDSGGKGVTRLLIGGIPLLAFRFRKDASKKKSGYNLMVRLLTQATPKLKDLIRIGQK